MPDFPAPVRKERKKAHGLLSVRPETGFDIGAPDKIQGCPVIHRIGAAAVIFCSAPGKIRFSPVLSDVNCRCTDPGGNVARQCEILLYVFAAESGAPLLSRKKRSAEPGNAGHRTILFAYFPTLALSKSGYGSGHCSPLSAGCLPAPLLFFFY